MQSSMGSARYSLEESSEESLKKVRKSLILKTSGKIRYSIEEASLPMVPVPAFDRNSDLLTWGNVLNSLIKISVN
jgi:hypothetical protein